MGKIKENHRSSHFTVGNIEPDYKTTNTEFRATSASQPKRFAPDTTPHVFLGNFKANLTTEKQGSFVKMQIPKVSSEEISSENRRSHLFMGKEVNAPLPTSINTYQGKQHGEVIKFFRKDYSTNVSLGSSNRKWESSYSNNYSTRGTTPYGKVKPTDKSNIVLGCSNEKIGPTTAQESFQGISERNTDNSFRDNLKNNSFSLGDFHRKFETSNRVYGNKEGKASKIDEEVLKNITACHFTYGNFKEEIKSKFQEDYGNVPPIPERADLNNNQNKKSNLSFGENQIRWESTYKKAFIKKK